MGDMHQECTVPSTTKEKKLQKNQVWYSSNTLFCKGDMPKGMKNTNVLSHTLVLKKYFGLK